MAHLTPRSQTNRRKGVRIGALLREYQYCGCAPRVRLMSNHLAVVGCPSLHTMIRLRANAYAMGPLVPSDTVRWDQNGAGIAWAKAATVHGAFPEAATRFVRGSLLEV